MFTTNDTMLNAVTATATSGGFVVAERKKLSIQVIAASITSGNSVFTIDISNDNVNWVSYKRINSNATNTNAQTDTRVASVTLSSNGTAMILFPYDDHFKYVRITATITTDGAYTAILSAVA